MMEFDTIAAISTPLGEGGIGIVRVSGSRALEVVDHVVQLKGYRSLHTVGHRRIAYGHVVHPKTKDVIDEVLVSIMKAPHTFTREDIVEVNCHGGIVPLQRVIHVIMESGARLAEPGEFTKRAFLNGRLDLAQAEAVIDIIRSQTSAGMDLAFRQLEGQLSRTVKELRHEILAVLAHAEAAIDFPEDVDAMSDDEILRKLDRLRHDLNTLKSGAEQGKIYRQGLKTVIIGRPNVGKSSLLNALLGEERAIVTAIAGTTRDTLEEVINIKGVPLRLIDTAGLRMTEDEVEQIGVARTRQVLKQADLVLWVLDGSDVIKTEDHEIAESIGSLKSVVVINKSDRPQLLDLQALRELRPQDPMVVVSAQELVGITQLQQEIFSLVMGGQVADQDRALITRARHQDAVGRALANTSEALQTLSSGMPLDCLTIDLKAAWEALGEISGDTIGSDLLDEIFGTFCIGK